MLGLTYRHIQERLYLTDTPKIASLNGVYFLAGRDMQKSYQYSVTLKTAPTFIFNFLNKYDLVYTL